MMFNHWDYPRALQELWNRSSYERGLISDPFGDTARAELGLRRMRALLGELGDPHQKSPAVHVAGSKGKGSTAHFMAMAAVEAGHRVGFYSSPHLHRFPERISLDGKPLDDAGFARVAMVVAEASHRLEASTPEVGAVTTFEFITAMAFTTFAQSGCDLAVIEVGLGGRYDATNVLTPLVSVITRIDLEHTAVLGPTHAEIAWQKAGIMRSGVPAVSAPQVPSAASALEDAAREIGAPYSIGGREWQWTGTWHDFTAEGPWGSWANLALGLSGPHQVENACTALAALHVVDASGLTIPEAAIRAGFAKAHWPGRFERHDLPDRVVVFDGAHTPAAAAALVQTWRAEIGSENATVVVGLAADKDIPAFLEALRPIIGQVLITRADSPRAADPAVIAASACSLGMEGGIFPSVAAAIEFALAGEPSPLLITGSLFVAGEGREALGLATPDLHLRQLNMAKSSRTDAP